MQVRLTGPERQALGQRALGLKSTLGESKLHPRARRGEKILDPEDSTIKSATGFF